MENGILMIYNSHQVQRISLWTEFEDYHKTFLKGKKLNFFGRPALIHTYWALKGVTL